MGMFDRRGVYGTSCPFCGGEVEYWYFDLACRGDSSPSGIQCKQCLSEFSEEEWKKAEEDSRNQTKKISKSDLAGFLRKKAQEVVSQREKEAETGNKKEDIARVVENLRREILQQIHKAVRDGRFWTVVEYKYSVHGPRVPEHAKRVGVYRQAIELLKEFQFIVIASQTVNDENRDVFTVEEKYSWVISWQWEKI